MSCLQVGFAGGLPHCGVDNAAIRWDAAHHQWECADSVRITEDGDVLADRDISAGRDVDVTRDLDVIRNAYLGGSDDSEHVLRGITSVIGDPNDQLLTVFGHAMIEYLNVVRILNVWGGQYPSYYGYGTDGVFYPGAPYWGSYGDDAIGPFHGTGTTIDVRGARFDGAPLMEQGFWIIREDTGMYYWLRPEIDDAGNLTWDVLGPWPYEPHASP